MTTMMYPVLCLCLPRPPGSARDPMGKAKGVIHKELWVIQNDGIAKLREDDFEAES